MLSSLLNFYILSTLSAKDLGMVSEISSVNYEQKTILKSASASLASFLDLPNAPIKKSQYISPIINAKSVVSLDLKTGGILYEKNANNRLPIASITKLMTILLIIEENKLNDVTTISYNAANTEGSTMFLHEGEEIAIENLVYGAVIHSANDAAVALAEYNAGTVSNFVDKMNKKAKEIGLTNTHFSNPVGLDDSKNYSSAQDIAKLGQIIYKNDFIKHAANLKELDVRSVSGDLTHKLESTNDLLENSYLKIKGLKTGSTDLAGLCLVSIAENDQGNEIITVVLNSPARFTETKILTDWTFRAYNW